MILRLDGPVTSIAVDYGHELEKAKKLATATELTAGLSDAERRWRRDLMQDASTRIWKEKKAKRDQAKYDRKYRAALRAK